MSDSFVSNASVDKGSADKGSAEKTSVKNASAVKPRFVSMKWKSVVSMLCSLTTLLLLLGGHYYDRYQGHYQSRLTSLRLQQLEELEKQVYRSGEQLYHFINAMVVNDPLKDNSNVELSDYQRRMNEVLPKLWTVWHIEEAVLIDDNNNLIAQLPGNPDKPQALVSLFTNTKFTNAKRFANTNLPILTNLPVSIICSEVCQQILTFPIIDNNAQIATLAISRELDILNHEFFERTQTHLALLKNTNDEISESKPTIDVDSLGNRIPSWHGEIVNGFQSEELKEAIHVASKHYSSDKLLGHGKAFQHQGITYVISVLPVRGYEDLSLRYVLLKDFNDDHQAMVGTIIQEMVVIFCLIAIFVAYLIAISWRHFGRVKQQIAVLPLLGQKQFSEVRDLVNKNRRHNLFNDELDTLDDAVTAFSYQLESLEKSVNLRTREMERLSLFDTLTGLANRNLLQYELQSDVQRFNQQGGILAIVIMDLDKFKRINDSLGHQLGDLLLGKIGARLKNATRSLGLVARLGGDEFAIILRSAKKIAQVEVLCHKIIELIRRPLELDNHSISISCSLGVALASSQQSGNDMVRHAEIAMYKAKETGGNAYRVFDPNMATEAHANLSLEADIRRAFENKEFTLFLQPKVNMEREIMGFESLIRWDHPDRGLVPPVEFIPAMENMGLISQLDNFVLDASCRQLKVLQTHYPDISIAVNISSTHFTDKNFLIFLKSCLDKYPINPDRLELEITETLLMENMNVGLEIIEQIKELGVSIAIDDFGTGYSSLSYLKKLPVDTIKIDREFIKDIPESESDMQISSVIIFLAKQLNFTVVAEGVETAEQLVFLKANQCDLAQGYLFSKPIPAHKAMLLLESRFGGQKLGIA